MNLKDEIFNIIETHDEKLREKVKKEDVKKVYSIIVYSNNGTRRYETYNKDIFHSFDLGEVSIRFKTTNGIQVSLPPHQVIIEQVENE
jgi:hypothetical protein